MIEEKESGNDKKEINWFRHNESIGDKNIRVESKKKRADKRQRRFEKISKEKEK